MARILFSIAATSGFISILMGAFGAHALRNRLDPVALSVYETAVIYQIFHSLLLLIVAMQVARFPEDPLFRWAAYSLISGIILFSGSLYGLSVSGCKLLGPVTPLGGLALMIGWLLTGVAAYRNF